MGRLAKTVKQQDICYSPLPSQRRFHDSTSRFKGFSGPIGSGKSQALVQEAIRLSYLNPGSTGLLGAPTYPMLRDATEAALLAALEKNSIRFEFNKSEQIIQLRDTGSVILCRAVDEFERLRGSNLAWFGLDELTYTQEEAWIRLEGRLRDPKAQRLCGFAVWTPKGFDWVYDRFIANPVDGYEVIRAAPRENQFILSQTPDYYDRLARSYDERFYKQEVLGEYLEQAAGRVYDSFDRRVHVGPVEVDPKKTLLWSLDFNVNPMSSVVAQVAGDELLVVEEIFLQNATTREACEEFHRRHCLHIGPIEVFGDTSGNARQSSGTTDFEIVRGFLSENGLRQAQFRVGSKNPPIRDRVLLVNARLRNAVGDVKIRIAPECRELIKDLEQVVYKPNSAVIDKERHPMRTHLSDALGYLIWGQYGIRDTVGERSHPLF
jgi:hypothetical protein